MRRPKLTDSSEAAGPSGGKEASAGVKQSEARFRASFENAAVGIAHVAPGGSLLRVNQRLCELTGYAADELLAKTLRDITHRDDLDAGLAQLRRMRNGGIDTGNSEKRYLRKDGSAIWIRLAASAVRKADGTTEFFILVFEDISEQKRAETALRESVEKFRGIFEHAPIGIAITDLEDRFQSCNRTYSDMLGYTEEELRTLESSRVLHSGDREENLVETSRLLAQQVPSIEMINRYLARNGDPIRVHKHVSLLRNSAGEPTGMITLVTDVTQVQQAEEALRESEERLRLSNEAAGIGTFTVDLETKCAHYSPETAAILGFPGVRTAPVEAAFTRVHRDDAAWVRKQYEEAASGRNGGQVKMDFRFVRPGGEVRWMTWMGRTDFREDQSGRRPFRIIGCCLDITERKQAEEALRESEERLRLSNEAAGIGTFTIDLETKCAHYSPKTAAILGFPEVRTAAVEAAMARVHRDDVAWVRKRYEEAASGTDGGQVKMDFRFVRPGGEVRWMTWMGRTDFREDQSGRRPYRIIGCCLDITERKRREEQVNFLMREVNHRSKNTLALVLSIARQTRAINPEDFITCFEERIQALAASQDLLIKDEWKGVNLDQLIRSQLAHFSGLIGTRIELRGAPLLISASAAQTIGMVLHELATNAGKYGALSNSSGRVEVEWATGRSNGGEETFEMSWRECGGPPVEAPKRQGFGTVVVCGMAEMSLNAKVDLSFAVNGLSWQLRCSAREILEAN